MNTHTTDIATERDVINEIAAARDALMVDRVFGSPVTIDDLTIVPVARISGGAGGGGGAGTDPTHGEGHGFGSGFGLGARPVGVYEVRAGRLRWRPALDADRLLRGAQIIVGLAITCATVLMLRRSRPRQ